MNHVVNNCFNLFCIHLICLHVQIFTAWPYMLVHYWITVYLFSLSRNGPPVLEVKNLCSCSATKCCQQKIRLCCHYTGKSPTGTFINGHRLWNKSMQDGMHKQQQANLLLGRLHLPRLAESTKKLVHYLPKARLLSLWSAPNMKQIFSNSSYFEDHYSFKDNGPSIALRMVVPV